eukprot:10580651-Ditylum_brightwellii.AAC.1
MARMRRAVVKRYSQQYKKSRTADHTSDDDSMDLNHSDMGENLTEESEQGEINGMNQENDGTDDEDENSNKKGKEEEKPET